MKTSKLGFGITGTLELEVVKAIAIRAEEIGVDSLWINDTPGGDSLARLEVAASVTSRLTLATGVIPVDRRPVDAVVEDVRRRELPLDRLILGIGSSAPPSPLTRIKEGLADLQASFHVPILVGALGPKMRQLGAERGNGLLFNWLTPDHARETTTLMKDQAAACGNDQVMSATYVRTALGADAKSRLETEAARYSRIPAYAANFARLKITAIATAVCSDTAEGIAGGILAFDGAVDHAIVRAITPNDDLDHYLRLLDAIAPLVSS
jgi:alkanesulfonate monooxygenase SsuD/methylene tetrahydromethanopterin reductase-like flavin-dependent oxidoreductase (luciferase family)